MAVCPEPRCHEGLIYYGVGGLHEQQTTACPTCRGTGHVPDSDGGPAASAGFVRTIIGWLKLLALGLAAFFAIGIGLLLFDPRLKDDPPDLAEVSAAPEDAARGLAIGSCVDNAFRSWELIPVDCGSAHEGEVFRVLRVQTTSESGAYPSVNDFQDFGAVACQPYFDDLASTQSESRRLFFTTAFSTPEEWDAGDRYALCLLVAGSRAQLPPGRLAQ